MTWKPQDPSVIANVDFDLGSTVTSRSTGRNGMPAGKPSNHGGESLIVSERENSG